MRRVSREGRVYSFKDVFGRSPGDHVIRLALDHCDRLPMTTLEEFPKILGRPAFRASVEKAYRSILWLGIGNETLFLAALCALAKNDDEAIAWAGEEAHREWREIDQLATTTMLSSLPATLEDLIEELEDPRGEPAIETWAEALEATSACTTCGTTIVQPFSFAEAVVYHYGASEAEADDAHERIENAVRSSGVEIGGYEEGNLCAYHSEQVANDD